MLSLVRPRRDFMALEARRMQAARLFQQGHPPATIVHQFHVSWQTAGRCYYIWQRRSGGMADAADSKSIRVI